MSARIPTLLLALSLSAAAFARDVDPPSRVARLSLIQGAVSFQAAGAGAPEEAELNRPLTFGDRLLTERGSRTEMSVGTAAIRLDERTDLSVANLDQDIVQLELNSGTLGIHVRELGEAETFEIDTPNAAVLLRQPGDYRIEVDAENATVLAVRTGEAELDGGADLIRLVEQQQLRFTGSEQVDDVEPLGPLTAFDEWCIEREQLLADQHTSRYVSRDVVGYEDLDRYGSWWHDPGYGYVWSPTYVSIGWSPYRFGYWSWIGPWGFTWIDYAPWGYAPFHYGRWAHVRHRWCWVPGPRHFRPVWAPALVGWHGMPGVRDPSHAGSVSWFPLGPREVYVPVHAASARYVRAVNVSNTTIERNTQITNAWRGRLREQHFANREIPNAMTSLPAVAFSADRAGRVLRIQPTDSGSAMPHVATSQPMPSRNSSSHAGSGFNPPIRAISGERIGPFNTYGAATRASANHRDDDRRASDPRRSLPRAPDDRRLVQGLGAESRAPDAVKDRRSEQPQTRRSVETSSPTGDSWRQLSGPTGSRQVRANAPVTVRVDRGAVPRGGSRAQRAYGGGRDNSGGGVSGSNAGGRSGSSGNAGSNGGGRGGYSGGRGGNSGMSGSRSQSGRGGGLASRP